MRKYWSWCKLGPARIYWVVGVFFEDEIIADGYAPNVEEAEEFARRIAGPEACQVQTYYAEGRHRRKVHERNMSRPAKSSGAGVRRYVYEARYSDYDHHRYVLAYPVLKTTKQRVYVSKSSFPAEHVGTEDEPVLDLGPEDVSFVLDRALLEAEGQASAPSQGWWCGPYYLDAAEALVPGYRQRAEASSDAPPGEVLEAIAVLGLTWPCTRSEFRSAYRRLSKETHPDTGGSTRAFVTINAAYDLVKSRLKTWPRSA